MKTKNQRFIVFVACTIVAIFIGTKLLLQPNPQPTFNGVQIWLVDIRTIGSPEKFVQKLRQAGVHSLCIKGNYGARLGHSSGPGRPEVIDQATTELVQLCHKYGIWCFVWGFTLGKNPKAEIKTIVQLLHRGADGYIFNVEGDLRGRQSELEEMVKVIWAHVNTCSLCRGKIVGADPLVHIRNERRINWEALHRYTQAEIIQVYWRNKYRKKSLRLGGWPKITSRPVIWLNYAEYNLANLQKNVGKRQVVPLGHAYRKTVPAKELDEFMAECVRRGYAGIGVYTADKFGADHWRVIAKYSTYFSNVPRPRQS